MPRIHQDVTLQASPETVYEALIRSDKHSEFTGAPAEIEAQEGGRWSGFGGKIEGRTVELVPNRRIVQTWRSADWPAGTHSIVRFELREQDGNTVLSLDHDAIPEGAETHLDAGWDKMYWTPLRRYLG